MVNKRNINLEKNPGHPKEILLPNDNELTLERLGMLGGDILSSKNYQKNEDNFMSLKRAALEVLSPLF